MRPEWSRLERRGQAAQVWRDSAHRFATGVVGPRFEQICRDWMQVYASPEINGVPVSQVGSGVVNDAEQKKSHEVDVAACGNAAGQPGAETARLFLFGGGEPAAQLRAQAANGEVQLVGLDELYS